MIELINKEIEDINERLKNKQLTTSQEIKLLTIKQVWFQMKLDWLKPG